MNPDLVQAEHDRLGYGLGWRFMTAPASNRLTSEIAMVGLNPGGTQNYEHDHSERWSVETGSSYVVETWPGRSRGGDPLQVQVQRMCAILDADPNAIFSGQFVPFRSDSWDQLPRRPEAVKFASDLWAWALAESPARLILCLGKAVVAPEIARLIGAKPIASSPSGWGDIAIDRYATTDGKLVVGLPHLGRFRLFGDQQRDDAFREAVRL